jgi:putative FmdB family regulatory protein
MPTYAYKCNCGTITEVIRPMKDIDQPPDNGCESCGSKDIERTIVIDPKAKNFVLKGTGWHADQYTSTRSRN